MVYVDTTRRPYGRMFMSHMIADTLDELHRMADAIGIKRTWFQGNASFPHYDICQSKKRIALESGAKELSRKPFVWRLQSIREAMNEKV